MKIYFFLDQINLNYFYICMIGFEVYFELKTLIYIAYHIMFMNDIFNEI